MHVSYNILQYYIAAIKCELSISRKFNLICFYSLLRRSLRSELFLVSLDSRVAAKMSDMDTSLNNSSSSSTDNEEVHGPVESNAHLVFGKDGTTVVRGSLQGLIEHLLPNKTYSPSAEYVYAFLLNIRMFANLADILHELIKFFIYEQNAKTENFRKENRRKCASNVFKLLLQWCDEFPGDFSPDVMRSRLRELLELCCAADATLQMYRISLLQKLKEKLVSLEEMELQLSKLQASIDVTIAKTQTNHLSEDTFDLLDNDVLAVQLAEHLSIIELEKLRSIRAEEFVYVFSLTKFTKNEKTKPVYTSDRIKSAANVQNYVSWCNKLNDFVATEICKRKRLRARVRIIEYLIDVAKECLNMGNFNSCVAIISALNMPGIKRLRKTWAKVDSSKLHALEQSMDPEKNFFSYRSTLEAAVWRCNGMQYQVVIPAFCVFCRDLFAIHKYCKDLLPNEMLNFQAFAEFAQIVKSFTQWRSQQCLFDKDDELYNYIQTTVTYNDKNLDFASFECEPPETNSERTAYKKLRVDYGRPSEPATKHATT